MKVLLIYPDLDSVPYLPLGIATLASVLEERGHAVTVWDLHAEAWNKKKVQQKISGSDTGNFDMVGISVMSHLYPYAKWLVSLFKKSHPQTPVVLGGPLPSTVPEITIQDMKADLAVIGEGEETLPELIDALNGKRTLSSVAGIAYAENGTVKKTPSRPSIQDMDSIPFPAWHKMPMDHYLEKCERLLDEDRYGTINIMTSRGCPYDCCYCDHTIKGYGVRRRSAGHVIAEIQALQEYLGKRLQSLYFVDDSFSINRKWIFEFCERLMELPDRPHWTCNTRVDLVDRELLTKMKDAGCTMVRYGLESGSPRILKIMKKNTHQEDFIKAVQLSRELKIHTLFTLMVGMLEETEESIRETREFLLELLKVDGYPYSNITFGVFITTPYPGTHLFEMAKQKGRVLNALDVLTKMDQVPPVNLTDIPDQKLLSLRNELQTIISEESVRKFDLIRKACKDIENQAKTNFDR